MRHDEFEGDEALDEMGGPHPMMLLLAVMLAGAVGVGLRYVIDAWVTSWTGDGFPWSTLIINVVGAFALGLLAAVLAGMGDVSPMLRPVIGIGLLGGFTTFSAFALETVNLVEDGFATRALVYVGSMNVLGIGAAVAGLAAGRVLR